jgi:hypothetical protein
MPTWWGIPAAALILGLVQVAKSLGFPSRYAGALAVVLGLAGGIAVTVWGKSALAGNIVAGLAAGLSAAGLWSTVKNSVQSPPPAA